MWTRHELKQKAKDQMKGRYFNYLAVSLMPQLSTFVLFIPIYIVYFVFMITFILVPGFSSMESGSYENNLSIYGNGNGQNIVFSLLFIVIMIAIYLFAFSVAIFFTQPIIVGSNRWIVRSRESKNIPITICFSAFKKGSYLKTVGGMAYMLLFSVLWTMLFYIPGIIKFYAYRMIPFILADNPGIGAKRALKLSSKMTKGHKMEMFVLDLSFLGWYLLGYLACFVGLYGVYPYHQATFAELYDVLKKDAVNNGLCTMEELGYVQIAN
ncbi:MAG: DUF975 family protein [Saccharofermentanales bacterium]